MYESLFADTMKAKRAAPVKECPLQEIIQRIRSGETAMICTATRITPITKKTLEKWTAAGYELLKEKNGSYFMGRGRHYDCIDYCHIAWK